MADFVFGIVPIIVEHAIVPVKRHVGYIFDYKSNLEHLDEQVRLLTDARDDMRQRVVAEERSGKLIVKGVEEWLQKVDGSIGKVRDELIQAEENVKKRCFVGLCPNLKIRYQLSKKAAKAAALLENLRRRGQFSRTCYKEPLQIMSIGDFEDFESRMPVLQEIMNVLKSVDVNLIGLHGIGGVGKTTLVKKVAKLAKEDKLFDEVVLATVTIDVNVQNIQGQIADFLDLKFDVETVEGRAAQLCKRLKQKKVLIILDDLWKKLDLEAVGIRFKDEHKGCKIVLTSRDLNVLSNGMDSQKNFPVGKLQEDEAWDLFKKMADKNFEDPDLQSTAKEVAEVCGGLPIAIVTVARALRNKSLSEWKNALNELRGRNFTEMQEVYSKIEFSYRHLEGEELQSIFLLCGQMGYNATTGDLLKYGIGLGLFHNVSTLEQAQDKVHAVVQKLKASCLLLDENTSKQLAMHDVVRDAAVSIASKENQVLIVDDENKLKEWAHEDKAKNYTAIWLRCKVRELPREMQCPKLVFFLVRTGDPDLKIPDSLFKGLYKLEVLNLTGFFFTYMPPSLGSLKNIKALCLHECVLENVGFVGELQKLEILSFSKSDIKHLPREIGELANLRLLDLSDCKELEEIPCGVLSRLCRLEELYLGNSFCNWEIEGPNSEGRKNASLLELKHLGSLTNLDIDIRDARSIPKDVFSEKLCRYRIFVGERGEWEWDDVYETSKSLKLELSTETHMDFGVIRPLLRKTEDLYLDGLKGVKNIVDELDSDGFPKLRHLRLSGSLEIQHIIDAMEMDAFPKLESLILRPLISLEKISHYKLKMQSFSKLRIIKVKGCDRLTYVFSFLLAQGLSVLEEIKVVECESMEEIVGDGNEFVESNAIEFSQLHSLSLGSLPRLKSFCSNEDGRRSMPAGTGRTISEDGAEGAMPLFNGRILFPNLKHLTLRSMNNQKLWHTHHLPATGNSFQNLTNVEVSSCNGLKYLFPLSLVEYLGQLKHLELRDCGAMEEVIGVERSGEEQGMNKVLFPKLQSLSLRQLPKLTRFCACHLIECPLLKELTIDNCPNLTTFVSSFTYTSRAISNEGQEKSQDEMQPLFDENAFPNLEVLELLGKGVAASLTFLHQFPSNLFSTIKTLHLWFVHQREGISIVSLQKFHNLKECSLYFSKLEEVFSYHGLAIEKDHTTELAPLRHLSINYNNSLRHIWDQDNHVASLLKYIETLHVRSCERLENLMPPSASFQNLISLSVKYCDGLSYLVTTMTAKSLGQLIHFEVESCDKVTEIIDRQGDETKDDIIFHKLQSLKLVSLKSLTSFYSGNYTFQFPSLEEVHVEKCPKLKVFSPAVINTPKLLRVYFGYRKKYWEGNLNTTIQQLYTEMVGFDGLKSLKISEFPELKEIWHGALPVKLFSHLESLVVDDCSFFSNVVSSNLLPSLVWLRKLDVRNCGSLEEVFNLERLNANGGHGNLLDKFEKLYLSDLPRLQHICNKNPQGILEFKRLRRLKIQNCSNLRNIFTPSMALGLVKLEIIDIRNCIMLEEIVTREREEEAKSDETIFPLLRTLILESLRNLININSGNGIMEFSPIEEITIHNCPNMKAFISSFLRGQMPEAGGEGKEPRLRNLDIQPTSPSFDEMEFTNLEKLGVDWQDIMEDIGCGEVQDEFLFKLRVLEINFPDELVAFPSAFLQKFPSLECLSVTNALFEEIILCDGTIGEGNHNCAFEQLIALQLSKLPMLKHLAKEGSQLYLVLQNLRSLEVLECGILETLVPSKLSFQCLTNLEVTKCGELFCLITSTTAKSLVQLTSMSISECEMMTQIIVNEEGEAENEIIFSKLRSLKLHCLPRLMGFSLWNCAFIFPVLKEVSVIECPNMKIFSQSVVRTPRLIGVPRTKGKYQWCWEGSLNATIQKLFLEMDQVVGQSIQPNSLQVPNFDHIEASTTRENKTYALFEEENSNEMCESKNLDASKEYTPQIGTTTTITTDEQALKGSYAEPEITQTASSYQIPDAILYDKTEPPQGHVTPPASIQQIGTAPFCSTGVNEMAPMSTFVSVAGRELPQETKRRKTVRKISSIEMDDNVEVEDTISIKPPTNPDISSVEQEITPTTPTRSSLPQNAWISLCPNLAKLDEISPEEMHGFLIEQQNNLTIESPNSTETVLGPTPTDVEEKVIRMAIKTISDFLSKAIEYLRDPTVVSDVQSACNLLCAAPVGGIVPPQQMSVIRNLSAELPLLTQRFQQASSAIEKDGWARFDFKRTCQDAASKIQEVAMLTEKRSRLQNHVRDLEVQLAMLQSRVKQDKEAMTDLGASIRMAGKEAHTLQLKAAESKKTSDLLIASISQAKADYEASKKQLETHASLFFKT